MGRFGGRVGGRVGERVLEEMGGAQMNHREPVPVHGNGLLSLER